LQKIKNPHYTDILRLLKKEEVKKEKSKKKTKEESLIEITFY